MFTQVSDSGPHGPFVGVFFGRQKIHMKHQALFSAKDKSKRKCRLLQFLGGAVRVK